MRPLAIARCQSRAQGTANLKMSSYAVKCYALHALPRNAVVEYLIYSDVEGVSMEGTSKPAAPLHSKETRRNRRTQLIASHKS